MSKRDPDILLRHMLDAAREAVEAAQGKAREDLERERFLALGLVKLIEIIGEAARQLSDADRQALPGIPWHQMIGIRHRLIHAYSEVDYDVVWDTVTGGLPPLIAEIERVIPRDGNSRP